VDTTIYWSPNSWSQGPVFQGYHRDSTIIRLTDDNIDFQADNAERALLWTGEGLAQKFDRGIRDMTIHTGSGNPGAVGIKFISNNEGILSDVNILSGDGEGYIGLTMSGSENGPLLVRNVYIYGFRTGIKIGALNSVTLCNISLANQHELGLFNGGSVCSIENLSSNNTATAISNQGQSAYLTLINSTLSGGSPDLPAIDNAGVLFARNIQTSGYSKTVRHKNASEPDVDTSYLEEATSHGVVSLFSSPRKSINLDIEQPPDVPWETDLDQWVNIEDYGAIADDGMDDSKAIQDAIDAGKTTVYFPNHGKFQLYDTVYIRGTVNRVLGTNTWMQGNGRMILSDGVPDVVVVERMRKQNPDQMYGIENHSSRTLVLESAIFHLITGVGSGKIFASDCLGKIHLTNPEVKMWCRHLNTEDPKDTEWNIRNEGAALWILGLKTEKAGVKSWVSNGGRTEILGAHIYPQCTEKLTPMIRVDDALFSGACIRETNFCNKEWPSYYTNLIIEEQDGVIDTLKHGDAPLVGLAGGKGYALYTSHVPGPDYPEDPFELEASAAGWNIVHLTWAHPGGDFKGFILQRKIDDYFITIDSLDSGMREYWDTPVPPITRMYYRIMAFNDDGFSRFSNIANTKTPVVSAPEKPASADNPFKIYPNPARDNLRIEFTGEDRELPLQLSIFTITGLDVFTRKIHPPGLNRIELPDLPAGTYIIVVKVDQDRFYRKLTLL